jgi:hypothetical protein
MYNHTAQPIRPVTTVTSVAIYVAKWPLRHVYGGAWLNNSLDRMLAQIGAQSVLKVYGLEIRDSRTPPRIHDLLLVSFMQALILLSLFGLTWWTWRATDDYLLPAFIVLSVFHVIPSDEDFLTGGTLEKHVPVWLKPLTSALSFFVSMPALIIALPAAIVWGIIGTLKNVRPGKVGR